ncbi:MAG: holo-ACP synthase [bacterium]|nr:holo-ACP synthase [bacterium]
MIIGIGMDMIENERVLKALQNPHFIERYFSAKEQELIQHDKGKAAGNYAVKESVAKSFGTGFRHFSLCDIEVLRDELGKPYVNLFGEAKRIADELGIDVIHVSITNTRENTSAFVVAEKR